MSDIIDRLQHSADTQYLMSGSADEMLHDAISEIRKLRAEVEGLRAENKRLFEEVERVDDLFLNRERVLFIQRREVERLLAVEAAHNQLQATLNAAGFVVVKEDGR